MFERPQAYECFDASVGTDGCAVLGPKATALREELDRAFAAWGVATGASAASFPALLSVEDLSRVDYFANFPHLALLATGLERTALARGVEGGSVPTASLAPSGHVLPSAACYGVYFHLRGARLAEPVRITTGANCFRREEKLDGLRRLLGFTMREIVCVGPRESVLDHLADHKQRLVDFAAELGLPLVVRAASDPFFDPDGTRAVMAKLFPVKEEFVFGGSLAIASVNFHRDFFGRRCDIRLEDGSFAFSGCVAFGLERWIASLWEHFGHDVRRVRRVLRAQVS